MTTIRNLLLAAALALPALAAQAQSFYYQSTMPDGRIVIGDKPAPGAKDVKKMPLGQGNISAPLSAPQPPPGNPMQQTQTLEASDAGILEAQRNLAAAKAALEAGREPQPGERIGTASGASRLTDAYAQRIKALEDGVTGAQKQLDDVYARRNATR